MSLSGSMNEWIAHLKASDDAVERRFADHMESSLGIAEDHYVCCPTLHREIDRLRIYIKDLEARLE